MSRRLRGITRIPDKRSTDLHESARAYARKRRFQLWLTQSLAARAGVMHSQLLGRVGMGNISRPEAAIAIYYKISLLLVIKYQWIVNASLSRYQRHPYLDAYGKGYF
jgi:hypothetical protein